MPTGTRRLSSDALDGADVVIVSGGVSVGPHDHVKPAFRDLGVEESFWGVSLRPGKPTWFGVREAHARFRAAGQPGVGDGHLPALRAAGARGAPGGAARRAQDHRGARASCGPQPANASRPSGSTSIRAEDGPTAAPTKDAQGSHVLTSLVGADGLALIAPGEGHAPAGERVEVELL